MTEIQFKLMVVTFIVCVLMVAAVAYHVGYCDGQVSQNQSPDRKSDT